MLRSSASKKSVVAGERDRPDVARRRARWIKYQDRVEPERLAPAGASEARRDSQSSIALFVAALFGFGALLRKRWRLHNPKNQASLRPGCNLRPGSFLFSY